MKGQPINSYETQHRPRKHRDYEPVAQGRWRATASFYSLRHSLRFIWKVGPRLLSKNQANVPLGLLRTLHAEVARSSVHRDRRRRLHPTERLCDCSISAEVDLRQTQLCAPTVLRKGGSYPNTARLLGQKAVPERQFPDWNSQLAELVPTPQKHGCADSDSVLEHLQLRKTPADMLVTLEKGVERYALRQMPH